MSARLSLEDRRLLRRLARSLDRLSPHGQSLTGTEQPRESLPGEAALKASFRSALDGTGTAFDAAPSPAEPAPVRPRHRLPAHPLQVPQEHSPSQKRPVPDRSDDKRVRRGQIAIEARLDLHGSFQDQAHLELAQFLDMSRHRLGGGVVLVITGKGRVGPGVLRQRLPEWLDGPLCRQHVAGYAPAHPRHGGQGAFYVFLRPLHPMHQG
jgi:DNA-nicking Smr family endonuclease